MVYTIKSFVVKNDITKSRDVMPGGQIRGDARRTRCCQICSTYQTQNFAMAKETYAQVVGREADDERAGWCRCIGGRRSESELRQTMAVEDD
jgi:hypothetical protein